jgi:hypothetical protein
MQTLPGLAAFGHFYVRASHDKFIKQADDYSPAVKDIRDDLLTAAANGIISRNPALYARMSDREGIVLDDETEYKPLRIRAAP